jgi:translation initiation factor IF-1
VRDGGVRDGTPLTVAGRIVESLPNALYKVELLGEKRQMVTAHAGGSGSLLRMLPGDEVEVELMAYDLTRGRIVRKRG